jgi:hypothetical protein
LSDKNEPEIPHNYSTRRNRLNNTDEFVEVIPNVEEGRRIAIPKIK